MYQSKLHIIRDLKHTFKDVESTDTQFPYKSWFEIPDDWISSNSELFAYYSHPDEMFLLPAFMCYMLRNFDDSLYSSIYMHILGTLGEYSKEKKKGAFKYKINDAQFLAIGAFINYYRHKTDDESWKRNSKRWV